MKKRVWSRVLAVALALSMCISMLPMAVFAEDTGSSPKEETNLLVFGASTSSGYGLSNFENVNRGFAVENNDLTVWTKEAAAANTQYYDTHGGRASGTTRKGRMSEDSYPWLLKNHIADQDYDGDLSKVNLSPLCLNGMRTNELHGFLDPEYAQAAFDLENELTGQGNGFYVEHLQSIIDCLGDGGAKVDMGDGNGEVPVWSPGEARDPSSVAYQRAHKYVTEEIKKADTIVIDVCMNNFGTYLANRVAAIWGIPGFERKVGFKNQTPETIVGASPELVEKAQKLKKTMQTLIPTMDNENIDIMLDAFIYCYVDCITNLSADIEIVNSLKKDDAKVIVVGVYNTLDGITTQLNGKVYDFGAITSYGFQLVNAYIKGLDKNSSNYYYADVSGGIETFMNQVVESESYEAFVADPENDDVLNKFYEGTDSFYDLFLKSMGPADMFRDPAKVLLYRAAKTVDLDMDELIANLSNLYAIGDEIGLFFNAALGYSNVPGTVSAPTGAMELTPVQKVAATSYFVDQKLQGVGDNDAMTNAVTAVVYSALVPDYSYAWSSDENKAIAQSAAFSGTTAMGVDEETAAAGIGVEAEDIDSIPSCPSNATMQLLQILDRFIVYQGIGQHPSLNGCHSMAEDVIAAYDKSNTGGNTAFDDFKEEMEAKLEGLIEFLRSTGAKDDIDAITAKIEQIQELMDVIDESGLTADDLREFIALKEQFQDLLTETLDLLGMSVDDLKQAMEETTPEQLAEIVNKIKDLKELVDILDEEGLTADQLKEALQLKKDLEARMNEVLDALGMTMDDVMAALDENSSPEKIKEYVEKYEQIKEILDVLDESGLTADQLKQAIQLKNDLEAGLNEALDALGITMDDLIAQGQFVANAVDMEKVVEIIKIINDIVMDLPGAQAELEAKITEFVNEVMAALESATEDIMEKAQAIADAVDIQKVNEIIRRVTEIIENLPAAEEIKAQIEEQIAAIQDMIKEKAGEYISDDVMKQLEELAEMLKKAVDENDYSEIVDKLMPIGQELLAIADAVRNLPEYEKAMNEYIELSNAAMAGLEDRVTTLEKQMAKVIAKSIDVDMKTAVTFPNKKVQTEVSWKLDEDAAGYVFTVDGKEAAASETENGLAYTHTGQKVGQKYTYEVTPFIVAEVDGENKTVYGKTFTKVVTPKVKVAKAKIKSVKAAKKAFTVKWKKVTGADGYQVSYKTGKKTKKALVKGAKKVSRKVKKLKSKKQYTVKVRAYKTVNGKKYWGKWSTAKKVKVK